MLECLSTYESGSRKTKHWKTKVLFCFHNDNSWEFFDSHKQKGIKSVAAFKNVVVLKVTQIVYHYNERINLHRLYNFTLESFRIPIFTA